MIDTSIEMNSHTAKALEEGTDLIGEGIESDLPRHGLDGMHYGVHEKPPLMVLVSVAFQHVLMSLPGTLTMSIVLSNIVCAAPDHPIRAQLFCTSLFMAGVSTVIMCAFGIRLPVFQGPSSSFLIPLLALANTDEWRCEDNDFRHSNEYALGNFSYRENDTTNNTNATENIYAKLRQLQGSLMAASLLEVIIGGTGMVGFLLRFIGPITVATTITLTGLALFKLPMQLSRPHWPVAFLVAGLVVLFAMYLRRFKVPVPVPGKRRSCSQKRIPIFRLFPILLSLMISWAVCGILTTTNVIPDDPSSLSYSARTDAKTKIVDLTPWLYFPYPGQFGVPEFNLAVFIGFVAAVISSLLESVGDYYAAAKICRAFPPEKHAVNRGILIEGVCSVISGAVGAGHATTSYSTNIAVVGITRVASLPVLVVAGFIAVGLAVFSKFGAVLSTIPDPCLGGVLLVILGMLTSLGISALQNVDLTSQRNLSVLGTAIYVAIVIPGWMERYPEAIQSGYVQLDQVITVGLGTPMFLGGILAVILDNTVPGTLEERGMSGWQVMLSHDDDDEIDSPERNIYKVPWIHRLMPYCGTLCRHIPFLQFYETDYSNGRSVSRVNIKAKVNHNEQPSFVIDETQQNVT